MCLDAILTEIMQISCISMHWHSTRATTRCKAAFGLNMHLTLGYLPARSMSYVCLLMSMMTEWLQLNKYRICSDLNASSMSYVKVLTFMMTKCYLYQCSSRGHQTLMRAPIAACFKMAIWAPEWPAAAAAAALLVRHRLWLPCVTQPVSSRWVYH